MGYLSQHWSFWERVKWMMFGEAPDRDVLKSELARLRKEAIDKELERIDTVHLQAAREEKIKYLERETGQ